ncbi:ABC transporter substrate-binding protein [Devosia soli]|uniref:ABC transporter substrate-binding protein n=1 Tax=Devosia soli TaxID=361041 RepID=A0A0F5L3B4_9HYPH|nr:ABC transporter substrate-binding protein [Devosia soli]KKB76705.1 ABC transporter substrate-binding protein [Devosia soli]
MKNLVASLAVLAAMIGPAAAAPFRLIVTDLEAPLVPNSVMDLAVSLGYFARENVEVELVRVQQTPLAVTALQAGEGEMANIGVDTLLQLVASGQLDLRAVMSPSKSLAFMIVARDAIPDVASLGGKSFGIGRVGSVDQTLSRQVLTSAGVDVESLEQVALGQPAARAQALAAGQIDATTMSLGTWTTLPDQAGLHVLIDQDAYYKAAPVVSKVNVVLPETLETRRPEVVAVVTALTKLARDISADPKLWVDAMAEVRPDLDRTKLESLADAYGQSWSVNGGLSAKELAFTADWNFKSADFADLEPVDMARWVDFSVVDEVLGSLGSLPDMDPADR